jgi:antitoxin MazE
MKVSVVRIGNSRGIRIPKAFLEHYRLTDAVELEVQDDHLVIRSPRKARQGWEDAFQLMHQQEDDRLLDQKGSATRWDRTEWRW